MWFSTSRATAPAATRLAVSRAAVWKRLRQLEEWGISAEALPGRGYKLPAPLDLLDAHELQSRLPQDVRARLRRLEVHESLESTSDRLLGVDSRVIVSAERHFGGPDLHNVGVFYELRVTGGELRPEPDGATDEPAWIRLDEVSGLLRASLVDIGLDLARTRPPTGQVRPVPVTGLLRH